jgi:hypothetical protein
MRFIRLARVSVLGCRISSLERLPRIRNRARLRRRLVRTRGGSLEFHEEDARFSPAAAAERLWLAFLGQAGFSYDW